MQPRQIHAFAIETTHRVVRTTFRGVNSCHEIAGKRVDYIPDVFLEGGHIQRLAVGRDRHPVATLRQCFFPERFFSH